VLLDHHVAKVDPDAEPDPALLGHVGLTIGHPALDLYGAPHRVHNTRKFRQEAVAGVLYGMAPVLFDFRLNKLPEMGLEPRVGPLLIRAHQSRVARHIGGEDGGETAGQVHVAFPAAKRRPERYCSRCSGLRKCSLLGMIVSVMARSRATISLASSSRPTRA